MAFVMISVFTLLAAAAASLQPWSAKILVDYGFGGAAVPDRLAAWLDRLGALPTATTLILLASPATSVGLYVLNRRADRCVERLLEHGRTADGVRRSGGRVCAFAAALAVVSQPPQRRWFR